MLHLLLIVIYLSFIGLGLPDALLGSAWPIMYQQFQVPMSYADVISMIIAAGTIVSSLAGDFLTHKLGTGRVTAISVGMTAVALLGFSVSDSFWLHCMWGVGAGIGPYDMGFVLTGGQAWNMGCRCSENSQALIGVQMASTYVGTCLMPPLFGLTIMHKRLICKCEK